MKTLNQALLTLCLMVSCTVTLAQKPKTGCVDAAVQAQADGIKLGLSKKGMTVFQEGMFYMTSMEPVPVAVKLSKGVTYHFIFVGSENANKLMLEIYDGKDRKVDEKIERSVSDIVYQFTPDRNDVYLITLTQKRALKNMCGYFGVMTKGSQKLAPAAPAKPVQSVPPPQPAAAGSKTPAATKPAGRQTLPDNQRPNPNRTKATREAQQQRR